VIKSHWQLFFDQTVGFYKSFADLTEEGEVIHQVFVFFKDGQIFRGNNKMTETDLFKWVGEVLPEV